jgi:hypothetical protein
MLEIHSQDFGFAREEILQLVSKLWDFSFAPVPQD